MFLFIFNSRPRRGWDGSAADNKNEKLNRTVPISFWIHMYDRSLVVLLFTVGHIFLNILDCRCETLGVSTEDVVQLRNLLDRFCK